MKYRLNPTKKQVTALQAQLGECRWLYNYFLEQRKIAWEARTESLSYTDQANAIVALKKQRPSLATVHSQVLQNVAVRIDLAFQAFFRRVKAGEKPGYPRFRGEYRYDSFTYPQSGFRVHNETVNLSKIGKIRIKVHRPIEGTIKTLTIRRTSTGKWFACFSVEVESAPLPVLDHAVGIDVGLESFATFSDGSKIKPPKFFRRDEKDLKRVQRKLSKVEKGTPERTKRRKAVARVHERIANRRRNFAHQHSRSLVNRFGLIAVEDLSVNRMVHNHCLAKSIHDAAWSQFATFLSYKAACAGRAYVAVNPAYTSQECSRCGHRKAKALSERVHRCECCGLVLDRDHNAAVNILRLGRQSLGLSLEAQAL